MQWNWIPDYNHKTALAILGLGTGWEFIFIEGSLEGILVVAALAILGVWANTWRLKE